MARVAELYVAGAYVAGSGGQTLPVRNPADERDQVGEAHLASLTDVGNAIAAAERAGARTTVLDGLGHWWMVQDPQRGAAALTEFWESLA